jgi:hypothetical protein
MFFDILYFFFTFVFLRICIIDLVLLDVFPIGTTKQKKTNQAANLLLHKQCIYTLQRKNTCILITQNTYSRYFLVEGLIVKIQKRRTKSMIHILDIVIQTLCEASLPKLVMKLYKSATIIISTNDTLSWIFIVLAH